MSYKKACKKISPPTNIQNMTGKRIREPKREVAKKERMGRVLWQKVYEDENSRQRTVYKHATKGIRSQLVYPFLGSERWISKDDGMKHVNNA